MGLIFPAGNHVALTFLHDLETHLRHIGRVVLLLRTNLCIKHIGTDTVIYLSSIHVSIAGSNRLP